LRLPPNRILILLFTAFALVWAVFLTIDYINKHPFYYYGVKYFKYKSLILLPALLCVGLLIIKKVSLNKAFTKYLLSSAGFFVLFLICLIGIGLASFEYANIEYHTYYLQQFVLQNLASLTFLFVFSFIAYLYGDKILKTHDEWLVKLGLGIVIISTVLFFLGAFGFINKLSVSILLLLSLAINYRSIWPTLKVITKAHIELSQVNLIGIVSLVFGIFFLTINFSSAQLPFPIGFDSRNFYINLSSLIADNNKLMIGFRPYNWELLMSIGQVLFNDIAYVLSFSFYGFIISCLAVHRIVTHYLKLDINKSFFLVFLISMVPSIVNELSVELKTDFGLLFFQLLSIILLFKIFKQNIFTPYFVDDVPFKKINQSLIINIALLGLCLGFGNTIKLTNLFLVFSIVILLVWMYSDRLNLLAILFITLGMFILLKFDDVSGLRFSHLSADVLKIVFLITGLMLLGLGYLKEKTKTLKLYTVLALLTIFTAIPLVPWVVKNYIETKSLSIDALINGKQPGPNLNARTIIDNYELQRDDK